MPLPDPRFVPCFPLQEYFVDKDTGFPLAAGIVTFYEDTNRTVLKPIYQQVQLANNVYAFAEVNNPVTLTGVGTFGDNNGNDFIPFLYPYEGLPTDDVTGDIQLYYVTVVSAQGVPQFTREAWPPGLLSGTNPTDVFEATENELANPQFVEVLFTPTNSHVFTVNGAGVITQIAPDWSIMTNGPGSVTVGQIAITDVNAPSNPPFALDISSTGITSLTLFQRLTQSPRLLANGFVSGSLVAATVGSASEVNLMMNYIPSTGTPVQLFSANTSSDGLFTTLSGTAATNDTNTESAVTGYVDISVTIPVGAHIQISSLQIVGVQNLNSSAEFIEQSTARQIDHLFHYYKPQIFYKPIPSYLVGWDFPLNPAQANTTSPTTTFAAPAIGANKSQYTWDQTIIFQTVDSSMGVTRGSSGEFLITAARNAQGAIIQYLPQTEARKILNAPICVNLSANTSVVTNLVGTISLYYTKGGSLPNVAAGTNNSLVLSLDANGKPASFNGTWVEVPRALGDAQFTLVTPTTTNFADYAFNGWDLAGAADANLATFFAIVIGFAVIPGGQTVGVNSVGLNSGYIPTRPAPQTFDEVLRECQHYYETSYNPGVPIGTATTNSVIAIEQRANPPSDSLAPVTVNFTARMFGFSFNTEKRVAPNLAFYSVLGTATTVSGYVYNNGAQVGTADLSTAFWNAISVGTKNVSYAAVDVGNKIPTVTAGTTGAEAFINFHYTADARLGIV